MYIFHKDGYYLCTLMTFFTKYITTTIECSLYLVIVHYLMLRITHFPWSIKYSSTFKLFFKLVALILRYLKLLYLKMAYKKYFPEYALCCIYFSTFFLRLFTLDKIIAMCFRIGKVLWLNSKKTQILASVIICWSLNFPEHYLSYLYQGANISLPDFT